MQLPFPKGWEALARIPWRGPGCTGIIATMSDGTVAHARNLDFSPVPFMTKLVFTGVFTKGGKEIFRSQMVAGYGSMVTGVKMVRTPACASP
jgi:penicillin V acylase-like amidase (Ntn superfamily)